MGRFDQRNIVRGQINSILSLNRYACYANNAVMYVNNNGLSITSVFKDAWNWVKQTSVGKAIDTLLQLVKNSVDNSKRFITSFFWTETSNVR